MRHLICIIMLVFLAGCQAASKPSIDRVPPDTRSAAGPFIAEHDPSLPRQELLFIYQGGAGIIPPEHQGVSRIIIELLNEGPRGIPREEYRYLLFHQNAKITFFITGKAFGASVVAPPEHFYDAVALTAQVIQNPKFDRALFKRFKKVVLTERLQMNDQMAALNRYFATRDLYRYHPRTLDGTGSPASIRKVTLPLVKRYFKMLTRSQHLVFGAIGPLPPEEVQGALERSVAYEPFTYEEIDANAYRRSQTTVTLINKPGAVDNQILVLFAQNEKVDSPRYIEGEIAQRMLGGGLSGRLGKVLRTQRGLTYHAGSGIRRDYWYVYTFGANKQVLPLLNGISEVIESFQMERLTESELYETKLKLATRYKRALELPSDRLEDRIGNFIMGFDQSFFDDYIDHVNDVTLTGVSAWIDERLSFSGAAIYIMGDKEKMVPVIEQYGIPQKDITIVEISDIE